MVISGLNRSLRSAPGSGIRSTRSLAPKFVILAIAFALTGCAQPNTSAPSTSAPSTSAPNTSAPNSTTELATASTAAAPARYYAQDGIAIGGADPVAYFTDSAYVPGTSEFTHDWNGVTWQFSSAKNRDSFAANPTNYEPQYGGFCAWAVSQGYTAEIDPSAWKIVEGKLYLNYDQKIQAKWAKDIPGNIAKANSNWPGVLSKG